MKRKGLFTMLLAGALICGMGVGCVNGGNSGNLQGGGNVQGGNEQGSTEQQTPSHEHIFQDNVCTVCGYYKIDADTDFDALVSDELTEAEWKAAFSEEALDNFKVVGHDSQTFGTISYSGQDLDMIERSTRDGVLKTRIICCWRDGYVEGFDLDESGNWIKETMSEEEYRSMVWWWTPTAIVAQLRSLKDKFARADYDKTLGAYVYLETDETHGMFANSRTALKFKNGKLCAYALVSSDPNEPIPFIVGVYGYGEVKIVPPEVE